MPLVTFIRTIESTVRLAPVLENIPAMYAGTFGIVRYVRRVFAAYKLGSVKVKCIDIDNIEVAKDGSCSADIFMHLTNNTTKHVFKATWYNKTPSRLINMGGLNAYNYEKIQHIPGVIQTGAWDNRQNPSPLPHPHNLTPPSGNWATPPNNFSQPAPNNFSQPAPQFPAPSIQPSGNFSQRPSHSSAGVAYGNTFSSLGVAPELQKLYAVILAYYGCNYYNEPITPTSLVTLTRAVYNIKKSAKHFGKNISKLGCVTTSGKIIPLASKPTFKQLVKDLTAV